jgi:1-deoxy-D-xylulose-5-phosphate synthase
MGTALGQACADAELTTPVRVMGLPHEFLAAGGREEILEAAGLGVRDIVATAVDGLRAGPRIAAPDALELMEIPEIPVVSRSTPLPSSTPISRSTPLPSSTPLAP